jgi:hypothetical protein
LESAEESVRKESEGSAMTITETKELIEVRCCIRCGRERPKNSSETVSLRKYFRKPYYENSSEVEEAS